MRMPLTLLGMATLLLLAAMTLPATATSASIGSATSSTCDTVAITIDTNETAGIGAATFTVVYDTSKVSLNSVANGALGTVTWDDASGTVTMTATDALACPTGNGITFADLEFCPVTGASGCSDLNLEVTSIYDCDVSSITPDSVNDGQFCIEDPNDPPTVTVTYPTSGTVNGPIDVTATATDTDGSVAQVAFYLMPGDNPIGTDTDSTDGWSAPLDTTTAADGTGYQIKAVATDNEGATGDDTGGVFAIDNSCPCDFCLELDAGWNLVSVPRMLDGPTDAKTVFNLSSTELCEYYDGCTGSWSSASPSAMQVTPGRGYMVAKASAEKRCLNFDDSGTAIPPNQQLCADNWNMVGFPSLDSMSVADFGTVTNLNGKFTMVWQWNSGWEQVSPPDSNNMVPGRGYLIWMTDNGVLPGMIA
jgi:hypothetical protein